MILKEITYSLGKKIQTAQFEPANYHASIKAEVEPNEDINKAYDVLRKIVQEQIQEDYDRARPSKNNFEKEIAKIKTLKELQTYYRKEKTHHKSVEFNRCIADKKRTL